MKRTCGDCGFYKEKLCGVAIQSGFPESHAACESFSTIAWKCEICGQPTPSPQNLIWDAITKQLVCPNCCMTLPIVSEEEQNDN